AWRRSTLPVACPSRTPHIHHEFCALTFSRGGARLGYVDLRRALALALDPALILQAQGLTPDPWQRELLFAPDRQVLLNCSRQSGKSTVVAALALHTALFAPAGLVLLLSPSLRQSSEIFRKVRHAWTALGRPLAAGRGSQARVELANGS